MQVVAEDLEDIPLVFLEEVVFLDVRYIHLARHVVLLEYSVDRRICVCQILRGDVRRRLLDLNSSHVLFIAV